MSTHDTADVRPSGEGDADPATPATGGEAAPNHPGKHKKGSTLPEAPDVIRMSATDYEAHEQTFSAFLRLTKWAVIVLVVLLVLMAIFLV